MTYELFIGDRTFSSWSLRGWLMFEKFDIPHNITMVGLYSGTMKADLAPLAPARLVPVMRDAQGVIVGDTLAMAEMLAEAHPDAGMWPKDPAARARARWMVCELHSGFGDLRNDCPMQLSHQWQGFKPSTGVRSDLKRVKEIWALARAEFGTLGPWLFGAYSLADVFFAPIAMRIAGYDLPVGNAAQAYVQAHLEDSAINAWRVEGLKTTYDPFPYALDLESRDWPELS